MWLLSALALPACAASLPDPAAPYGNQQATHLEPNQPAPFAGWLLSDSDLEWLLKSAQPRQ